MVKVQEAGQDALQVRLIENGDVVQTFAAKGADQALGQRVLPGRPGRRDDFFNSQVSDRLPHSVAVDRVPVADEEARRRVERERLPDLPADPRRGRMRREVEMKNPARRSWARRTKP
jgi:hypothetical protein